MSALGFPKRLSLAACLVVVVLPSCVGGVAPKALAEPGQQVEVLCDLLTLSIPAPSKRSAVVGVDSCIAEFRSRDGDFAILYHSASLEPYWPRTCERASSASSERDSFEFHGRELELLHCDGLVQARLAQFDVGCDLYAWFDGGVAESGAWRRILASIELLDNAYGC